MLRALIPSEGGERGSLAMLNDGVERFGWRGGWASGDDELKGGGGECEEGKSVLGRGGEVDWGNEVVGVKVYGAGRAVVGEGKEAGR